MTSNSAGPTLNRACTSAEGSRFAGRLALVTGGANVIGGAVIGALQAGGANVIAADYGTTAVDENLDFASCPVLKLDVTKKNETAELIGRIEKRHGPVDLLVNVASVVAFGGFEELGEGEWDHVLGIDLKRPFMICKAVIPGMRAKNFGRIVNIGSVIGKNMGGPCASPEPRQQEDIADAAHRVSKAGAQLLTSFFVKELAGSGVTINSVASGMVTTATNVFPLNLKTKVRLGDMWTVDEIARAVVFLLSDGAGSITGEMIDATCGRWCP